MKKHFAALSCLLTAFAVSGASPDGVDYQKVTIGGDTYSLTCEWLEPNVLYDANNISQPPTDFFVVDDVIYYNTRNGKNLDQVYLNFYAPNASEEKGILYIDCKGLELKPYAFNFIGTDSEGTPFFASYASNKYKVTDPFTIVPIEISNGKAKASKVINLELINDWYTDEVWISGSLKDEKFRLIARIKTEDNEKSLKTLGYAEWNYNGSEKSKMPIAYAGGDSHNFSAGVGVPVGDDKLIIYDAAMPYDQYDDTKYTFTAPTLCSMDDTGKAKEYSTFDGEIANEHGTGLDIVEYDGKHFMLYGSGFAPATYGVAYLPDYPNTLSNSSHLWTLGSKKIPYSDAEESLASFYMHDAKPMAIHADKDTSNGLQFYTLTNQRGMAKYTLRKESNVTVGLTEVCDNAVAEYYSIDGLRFSELPSRKGVYICRKGHTTTKIFVK